MLSVVMLSIIMLSVIILIANVPNVIILCFNILSVVMFSVIILIIPSVIILLSFIIPSVYAGCHAEDDITLNVIMLRMPLY
jgi:hypothetical protein